jgi:IS5 family transposase
MTQTSVFDAEYAGKRKQTRREIFLAEMEQVVPWGALPALIEPVYPKASTDRRGSTPFTRTLPRRPMIGKKECHC